MLSDRSSQEVFKNMYKVVSIKAWHIISNQKIPEKDAENVKIEIMGRYKTHIS